MCAALQCVPERVLASGWRDLVAGEWVARRTRTAHRALLSPHSAASRPRRASACRAAAPRQPRAAAGLVGSGPALSAIGAGACGAQAADQLVAVALELVVELARTVHALAVAALRLRALHARRLLLPLPAAGHRARSAPTGCGFCIKL